MQMGMICPIYRIKVGHWQEKHLQGTYLLPINVTYCGYCWFKIVKKGRTVMVELKPDKHSLYCLEMWMSAVMEAKGSQTDS